jgi:hypothetical protein
MDQRVEQDWVNYKERQRAEQEAEAAKRAEMLDLRARAKTAGELAINITEAIGFEKDNSYLGDVYNGRISNLVKIGKLPEVEGEHDKFGFAVVSVYYDIDIVEHPVKGRLSGRVAREKVKGNHVQEIDVLFYAGDENGKDLERFAVSQWALAEADNVEAISLVENDLEMVANLVGCRIPGTSAEM